MFRLVRVSGKPTNARKWAVVFSSALSKRYFKSLVEKSQTLHCKVFDRLFICSNKLNNDIGIPYYSVKYLATKQTSKPGKGKDDGEESYFKKGMGQYFCDIFDKYARYNPSALSIKELTEFGKPAINVSNNCSVLSIKNINHCSKKHNE